VSSQVDTERAGLDRERKELAYDPEHEHAEMTGIYVRRGLDADLVSQVATRLMAQDAGETVVMKGVIDKDVCAAGGRVDILATVEGNVVVAEGRVVVGEHVNGDVRAAGDRIVISGRVKGDVKITGRSSAFSMARW
jgi:hypothetical protein